MPTFRISRETFDGQMVSTDVEGDRLQTVETDHGNSLLVFHANGDVIHETHVPAHNAYEWEEVDN